MATRTDKMGWFIGGAVMAITLAAGTVHYLTQDTGWAALTAVGMLAGAIWLATKLFGPIDTSHL